MVDERTRAEAVRAPRVLAALDAVTQFCNVCGSLLIFALMVLIVVDVLGRNLAGAPLPGVPEMVALSIVAIVFLQSPQTLRAGRMPRSEALLSVLERRAPRASLWLLDLHDHRRARHRGNRLPRELAAAREGVGAGHLRRRGRRLHRAGLAGQGDDRRRRGAARAAVRGPDRAPPPRRRGRRSGTGVTPFDIGLVSLGAMVALVLAGLHVPIALMLTSWAGVWAMKGSPVLASKLVALAASDTISSYFFGVVPLFVLMGFLVSESGMGRDAFDVANRVCRRLRGGLGVGTVGANAIFAAITGISIASAAVFTKIAVPQMIRHGYAPRFAVGVVAGSSVLGMLIPPSLLLILYGILTEQSIGDLFIAGIGPGLLLALCFALGIVALATFAPGFVGQLDDAGDEEAFGALELVGKGLPIVLLIALVLGGIYAGFFTPVEAGAMGAAGALLLGLAKRRLSLRSLWKVLVETGLVTASICFLIIAAQMYSRMLAFSGVPAGLGAFVAGGDVGFWTLIGVYVAVVVAMGMILDSSSIMLILVPLMLPVVVPMGLDLVWFGIVTVLAVEIGLLTPPFGISVYVIKSTLDDPSITLGDVFAGAAPFALVMLAVLGLVIRFPVIATGLLPN